VPAYLPDGVDALAGSSSLLNPAMDVSPTLSEMLNIDVFPLK
jgi:hypothetical protein